MTFLSVMEGQFEWDAPGAGKSCKTWYKVVGDLQKGVPLITLHGGPGAGHEYLTPLLDLHKKHGMPIVFYDQVGCARSTRFPEKLGDESFWTVDLFIKELDILIDHLGLREGGYNIIGQSWGGLLGAVYASRHPRGLNKLIIHSGPASGPLYVKGVSKLLKQLPPEVQKTIKDCERRGDFESPEYEEATDVFNARHLCRLDPLPDDLLKGFEHLKEDPSAYLTMQGPSEFTITGPLKDWEPWKDAHKIHVDTLLINGQYDEVTDISMEPWFKVISRVKWVTIEDASHMSHYEQRARYMELCGAFLMYPSIEN